MQTLIEIKYRNRTFYFLEVKVKNRHILTPPPPLKKATKKTLKQTNKHKNKSKEKNVKDLFYL